MRLFGGRRWERGYGEHATGEVLIEQACTVCGVGVTGITITITVRWGLGRVLGLRLTFSVRCSGRGGLQLKSQDTCNRRRIDGSKLPHANRK